jgi:hypothetical protein
LSTGRQAEEKVLYETLVKLAKAVIVHKYGSTSRIDYATIPHDVATSMVVTIVMRRKEVFSWTNLMKKVVRDAVSNYLRKEHYGMSFVELDAHEDGDGDEESGAGDSVGSRFEFDTSVKTDDIIYVKQMLVRCSEGLHRLMSEQRTLQQHLVFKLALHEVATGVKHYLTGSLPPRLEFRYNLYVATITMELAPVLSSKYLGKMFYC